MAKELSLAKFDIDIDGLLASQGDYLSQMQQIREEQTKLKKETKNLTDASDVEKRLYAEKDAELKKLQKSYNKNKNQLAENATGINNLSEALNKEVKSIDDAIANNSKLRKIRNGIKGDDEEAAKARAEVNKKINENTEFIKENSSEVEKNKINIGNYASALDNVVPGLGNFAEKGLESAASLREGAKATTGFNKVLKLTKAAIIGTGIGLLVVAFAAVGTAIAKVQGPADQFNIVLSKIGAGVNVIVGRFAKFGTGLTKLLSGEWKEGLQEMQNSFKGVSDQIGEAVEKAEELEKQRQFLDQQNINLRKSLLDLNEEYARQNAIADDATISLLEQQQAAEKAARINIKIQDENLQIARNNAEEIGRIRQKAKDESRELTRDEQREIIELEQTVSDAEIAKTEAVRANAIRQRQIRSDLIEQELDILIDGADNQKAINERIIGDNTRNLKERQKLLNQTQKMLDKSLEKQVSILQTAATEQIDINDLLATSDATLLKEKIKNTGLSEVLSNRLLEVVRERRTAEQDFYEAQIVLLEEEQKARAEAFKERLRQEQANIESVEEARQAARDLEELKRREAAAQELQELRDQGADRYRLEKKALDQNQELEIEAADERLKRRKEEIEKEVKDRTDAGADVLTVAKEAQAKLALAEQEHANEILDINAWAADERLRIEQEKAASVVGAIANGLDSIDDFVTQKENRMLSEKLDRLDAEKQAIADRYDEEIAKAGNNAEEVAKLEQEKSDKIAEIDRQAEIEKLKGQRDSLKRQIWVSTANAAAGALVTLAQTGNPGAAFATFGAGMVAVALMVDQLNAIKGDIGALASNPFGGETGGNSGLGGLDFDGLNTGDVINIGTPNVDNISFDDEFFDRIQRMEADLGYENESVKRAIGFYEQWTLAKRRGDRAEERRYYNLLDSLLLRTGNGYATGTDYLEGPGTGTSDSIPILASKGERIVTAADNELIGRDFPNEDLPKAARLYRMMGMMGSGGRNMIDTLYLRQALSGSNGGSDGQLRKEVRELNKTLRDKKMVVNNYIVTGDGEGNDREYINQQFYQ